VSIESLSAKSWPKLGGQRVMTLKWKKRYLNMSILNNILENIVKVYSRIDWQVLLASSAWLSSGRPKLPSRDTKVTARTRQEK
jgi:hypothetical protein